MTDKEKIHQILSSLWKSGDDSVGKTYYNQALQDVQTAIDLQEEPVSEELEKEIEMIRKYHFINDDFDKAELDGRTISNIARHFAKWQKEQMMAKAIDAELYSDGTFIPLIGVKDKEKISDIKFGDKIKVILIKNN